MATQLHLSVRIEDAPRYRINPGAKTGGPFAVLDIGPLDLTIDSPAELRRLADVAANAADVLEAAQAAKAMASKCCPAEAHDMMRANDAVWSSLEAVGYQDDGAGGQLELRNCKCGGTISRPAYGGVVMEVAR